jgi:dipeptidyl aminopeptidase/acylaminoacyl peptidase
MFFRRQALLAYLGILLIIVVAADAAQPSPAQAAGDVGYVDFSFFYRPSGGAGPDAILTPTGEKPQSKLWFNDGRWWADLFSPAAGAHHIYVLDHAAQRWVDTGVALDPRPQTKADCLWDGAHLYVVSGGGLISTGANLDARLYRYSYAAGIYVLDPGFPVTVRSGGAETIAIAKDTTGTPWVTYTQHNAVYVNRSRLADSIWGTPFVIPTTGVNATVALDDISALVAYGNAIGVLWSNQTDGGFYFAYHIDGAADDSWSGGVAAWRTNLADDHISLKAFEGDPAGNVFAAVKTSLNAADQPQIVVLAGRRQSSGGLSWRSVTVSNGAQNQTRPVLLIDGSNRQVYVFSADESGGAIYYKHSSLDNVRFDATTKGTLFLSSSTHPYFNNPSSTKQTLSSVTGIVVAASYDNEGHPSPTPAISDVYGHNLLQIAAPLQDRRVYLALMHR